MQYQAHLVKSQIKILLRPTYSPSLIKTYPTHNVNCPVGDKLRPDKAFQGADIAARWCSAPSRNCPQPHVAVLLVLPLMTTAHTIFSRTHSEPFWRVRTLPAVKFWDNFTVLRIHAGILFPARLSGRGRGQEIPSCGCCKAVLSLCLSPSHCSVPIYPHTTLNTQPSSLPDPLQLHQGTKNLNLYYLLIKTNITQQKNPKPRLIFLYKQLRKHQKG